VTDQTPAGDALQFDKAEFSAAAPAQACAACKAPLVDAYFAVGGSVVCPACRERLFGPAVGAAAFPRAVLWGAGAALVGTLAWFAVVKIAHVELGIVAVAVGFFVGKAVRRASGGLGGPRYQALAMVLTYASIVSSYALLVLQAVADEPVQPGLARVLVYAVESPFLGGTSNLLGLVIIGIALYEAWKLNRPVPITGPFRVAAPALRVGGPVPGPPPVGPVAP
jgi:hypothetical protein